PLVLEPPRSPLCPYTTLFRSPPLDPRVPPPDPPLPDLPEPLDVAGEDVLGAGDLAAREQVLDELEHPQPGRGRVRAARVAGPGRDRKSTRLNSSHQIISYAVF